MKRQVGIGMCFAIGFVGTAFAVADEPGLSWQDGICQCGLILETDPPAGVWSVTDQTKGELEARTDQGYQLALKRNGESGHTYWSCHLTKKGGETFRVTRYAWQFDIPLGSVATVFDTQVPPGASIFRQSPQIDVALEVRPNRGIPFLMTCDHYGRSTLAAGAIDQQGTYRLTGRRDGEHYRIQLSRTEYEGDRWFVGSTFDDACYVSTRNEFWFDAARAYADAVDHESGYVPNLIPASAYEPYFSTWYAMADKINEQVIWDNAVLADEMGIGTFLVFIGWSECENWFSSENHWGDYTPCGARFSDFAALVRKLHDELGMAVQVWVAPTWIGAKSSAFENMRQYRCKWPEGDYDRNLDPRSPQARDHIAGRFAHMAREYDLDGFYVDFLDTVYNRNDAPHEKDPALFGAGLARFEQALYKGFSTGQKPPLAEYRIPFANLLSKHHATVFNTTYSEEDWNRNRLLAVSHKPFSHGVVTRCDPLRWTPDQFEDREFVSKTLSAVMFCGPPGISMDLTKMSPDRREQIRRWFAFYREHQTDLAQGAFRPFGEEYHQPEMMVCRGHTGYAWVKQWETENIPFPDGTRHVYLFLNVPRDESFIARLDVTRLKGLVSGRYRAQWYDTNMESHDGPFEITLTREQLDHSKHRAQRNSRERWDFPPDDLRLGLHIKRGGYLELECVE